MVTLPRLVIAAPASGHGKTTVATGLMAALRGSGHRVSGHKIGPDFIDPGYHALATGRPGRNLDPHLVGEERIAALLAHGAHGADLAIIEGVMGLFDGQIGTAGFASTAHVATLTGSPVILVVDISHASRSIAAIVHGMASFDPAVRIAGVILNKAGSQRHAAEVSRALASTGVEVLGVLHRDDGIVAPSRHLGLLPVAERPGAARALERLTGQIAERIDLPRILQIARTAPSLAATAWDAQQTLSEAGWIDGTGDRPVVAVAGGRAFTFRYTETAELLVQAGCEVVEFDPLSDPALPPGTRGLYLGGGFPEVHTGALGANAGLLAEVRARIAAGLPTVAECAGLLYLCRELDGVPMVGALPAAARMTSRLTLAYRTGVTAADSVLGPAGLSVTGHEFHRTTVTPAAGDPAAWRYDDRHDGFAGPALHAAYLHTHWAGHGRLAAAFAGAVHRAPAARPGPGLPMPVPAVRSQPEAVEPGPRSADPLRHHGDVEALPGMADFAVNVVDGPRPEWLDRSLMDALGAVHRYPDAAPATADVARHHDRPVSEVLLTSGAAEAFGLIARLRTWRRPVVVHPQFTEPDVALTLAGCPPGHVLTSAADGFALDPDAVPADADLVVVGNPTNPTSVLHPACVIRRLLCPGRVVVVDEAFMDAVPGERESLAGVSDSGLLVVRSLTKLWSVPGIRAGYVLGDETLVAGLRELQTPWSVSTPALAVMQACSTATARVEATRRGRQLAVDRAVLTEGLATLGIPYVPQPAGPFVLARPGAGVWSALRAAGIAVRRADTFPGLDDSWVRIAVRSPAATRPLLEELSLRLVRQ